MLRLARWLCSKLFCNVYGTPPPSLSHNQKEEPGKMRDGWAWGERVQLGCTYFDFQKYSRTRTKLGSQSRPADLDARLMCIDPVDTGRTPRVVHTCTVKFACLPVVPVRCEDFSLQPYLVKLDSPDKILVLSFEGQKEEEDVYVLCCYL